MRQFRETERGLKARDCILEQTHRHGRTRGIQMIKRIALFVGVAAFFVVATILAQGPPQNQNREAPATNVTFDRLLKPNQEPQNWLTYGGNLSSWRHSDLTEITPANTKELELKWVFQSRSLEKHEVTPLVVNGVMYTIQSPNDVIAL